MPHRGARPAPRYRRRWTHQEMEHHDTTHEIVDPGGGDPADAGGRPRGGRPDGAPPLGIAGPRGGGPGGPGGHDGGFGRDGALLDAAASYFGVSDDQLRQDLAAVGTWQAVAAKYGKDNDAGKAGLRTALAAALRQSLTAKGLDAAQVDQQVSQFEQSFDQFYTQPAGQHGPGGPRMP